MATMSAQRFEYVAVQLGLVLNEKKVTEKINSVAEHGWRMIQVLNSKNGAHQIVFERPVNE